MVSEFGAAAIFPRRSAEPEECVEGLMFLLGNSMMNAIDVSGSNIGKDILLLLTLQMVWTVRGGRLQLGWYEGRTLARTHPRWSRGMASD